MKCQRFLDDILYIDHRILLDIIEKIHHRIMKQFIAKRHKISKTYIFEQCNSTSLIQTKIHFIC